MKTKTLILTIFFFYAFANVCDAQFNLGNLISKGITAGKAIKEAKKKQKELRDKATLNVTVNENQNENNDSDAWSWQDGECTVNENQNENQNENNDSITGTARNIETSEMSFPTKNTIANPKDEVALTVSADGATKEEATKIALRSAVEQAYGAFVSANTTILNDEMVKDEIVTISNGSIKSYQEVASALLPNGRTTVTLNAIVSISKLTSYAQSKGATTEFAGATFAMNVKMRELNKKNEMKALDNLIAQIKALLPVAFDRELVLSEPELCEKFPLDRPMLTELIENNKSASLNYYFLRKNRQVNPDNYYLMTLRIKHNENENTEALRNLISSTLKALEPTEEEYNYFKTPAKADYCVATLAMDHWKLRTRLSLEEFYQYDNKMNKVFIDYLGDFEILDNTGVKSSFNLSSWAKYLGTDWDHIPYNEYKKLKAWGEANKMTMQYCCGTGIFNPVVLPLHIDGFRITFEYFKNHAIDLSRKDYNFRDDLLVFSVLIPKADIEKYTQFTIRPKTKN